MSAIAYKPLSKGYVLGTFVPTSMAFELSKALKRLNEYCGGDVDTWVQRMLCYDNVEAMFAAFAAEQVDAIGLAIMNIEKGQGMIIADQTGIGKGRIAAGIIRYGVLRNIPTTFITLKSGLFSDMYRDLTDIGFQNEAIPFTLNTDIDARITVEVDNDGEVELQPLWKVNNNPLSKPLSITEQKAALTDAYGLPKGYNCVFTTYSQLNADEDARKESYKAIKGDLKGYKEGKKDQMKTQFLKNYAKNGIIIMDESHAAGGDTSNVGFYIQSLLVNSKGCVFLSATFAKQPKNMTLYATKTALGNTKLNREDTAKVFQQAGVALQEGVASALVAEGQLVRRQRTFDTIKFHNEVLTDYTKKHRAIYDNVMEVCVKIGNFQARYVNPVLEGFEAYNETGTEVGIDAQEFASKIHMVVKQLLFSIKAEQVAERAIELLNEDKKVLVAFSSTFGSFLESLDYTNGDEVTNDSFALILENALKSSLKYAKKTGWGKTEHTQLTFSELGEEGQAEYKSIIDFIGKNTQGISMSPVDVILNKISAAKRPNQKIGGIASATYRVGECTGRTGRIASDGTYIRVKNRKKVLFSQFNGGDCDVLLINQSASTGVSAHASEKFRDKRKRVMLLVEPELDINEQVQKLGRINRSGQLSEWNGKDVMPEYIYMSCNVPSELRLMMITAKKLKSLDANTSANQENSKDTLQTPDFMNKYGFYVAAKFLLEEENKDIIERMGGVEKLFGSEDYEPKDPSNEEVVEYEHDDENATPEQKKTISPTEKGLMKITNRVSLLTCEQQDRFYNTVIEQYNEYIERLTQRGDNDLLIQHLDYDANLKSQQVYTGETTGKTIFGISSYLGMYDIKNLRKPFTYAQLISIRNQELKGGTNSDYIAPILAIVETNYTSMISDAETKKYKLSERYMKQKEEYKAKVAQAQTIFDELTKDNIVADDTKVIRAGNNLAKYKQSLDSLKIDYEDNNDRLTADLAQFEKEYGYLTTRLNKLVLGGVLKHGVVVGVLINLKAKVLKSFSVKGMRDCVMCELAIPMPERSHKTEISHINTDVTDAESEDFLNTWETKIRTASGDRSGVKIVTGNILKGFAAATRFKGEKAKMIKFKMHDGSEQVGIQIGTPTASTQLKATAMSVGLHELKLIPQRTLINQSQAWQIERNQDDNYIFTMNGAARGRRDIIQDKGVIELLTTSNAAAVYDDGGAFAIKNGNYIAPIKKENIQKLLHILGAEYGYTVNIVQDVSSTGEAADYETAVGTATYAVAKNGKMYQYTIPKGFKLTDIKNCDAFVSANDTTIQFSELQPNFADSFKDINECLDSWSKVTDYYKNEIVFDVNKHKNIPEMKKDLIQMAAKYNSLGFGRFTAMQLAAAIDKKYNLNLPYYSEQNVLKYLKLVA
jgi:C-terminal domain on Strawberry notch homologue/P-loop containing NTP hydrolase pore-1